MSNIKFYFFLLIGLEVFGNVNASNNYFKYINNQKGFRVVTNISHIVINSCNLSYIGGGFLRKGERFGNGIEFWESNTNCIVQDCIIDQIYDSGLTNQGTSANSFQEDITYNGNTISNCGLASFEYFNSSEKAITNTIIFENNTSDNAGFGRAPPRKGYGGYHLLFHRNASKTSNFIIKNNTFNKSRRTAIMFHKKSVWNGFENMIFKNNKYTSDNKESYLFRMFTDGKGWENYKFKEKENYITKTNKDIKSHFIINPNID